MPRWLTVLVVLGAAAYETMRRLDRAITRAVQGAWP